MVSGFSGWLRAYASGSRIKHSLEGWRILGNALSTGGSCCCVKALHAYTRDPQPIVPP